jgi:RecA-family ATPase
MRPWLKPGTLSLIFAATGAGKTMFCLSIAFAITTNKAIGNWKVETAVSCLYIDSEMPYDDLRSRISRIRKSLPEQLVSSYILSSDLMRAANEQPPNLVNKNWQEAISQTLKDNNAIKLVILDNISSLFPGPDENAKHYWDPVNQWILELRSLGVAFILVHHTGKNEDQRGITGRLDNLDVSIKLSRLRITRRKKAQDSTSNLGLWQ